MAIKIELIGNAVVMSDTVTSEVIGESPKSLVYYDVNELNKNNNVVLLNIDCDTYVQRNWKAVPIGANLVDSGNQAYTVASFKTFARTNLGA
jgi:hypothetical protein